MSGKFVNGKINGVSKVVDVENGYTLNGYFNNGVLNGRGVIKFTDGKSYKGELKSDELLNKISIVTIDGISIDDVVIKHGSESYDKKETNPAILQFDLTGEVYYLNDIKTKIPLVGAKVVMTYYKNNQLTNQQSIFFTDKDGRFVSKLDRGIYKIDVTSNNQYFNPISLDNVKLFNNVDKNLVLTKTKAAKNIDDDFISIGVQTIFNNTVRFENKIYKKSNNKFEYCKRFTDYYYKVVLEKKVSSDKINQNNLINSKNFIINCYKEYVTKYDQDVLNKIKKLSNLGGDIETFEL
jgi:hypothetical protein